jgi:hypothetical protein
MYGTALPNIIVVLMYIGYFTSSAILGGQATASLLHVTTAEGIIIINAFVLLIAAFGYDMFHAYNRIVTFLSTGAFLAIICSLLARAELIRSRRSPVNSTPTRSRSPITPERRISTTPPRPAEPVGSTWIPVWATASRLAATSEPSLTTSRRPPVISMPSTTARQS